jgi:putative ABC transport system substrate-binding protein
MELWLTRVALLLSGISLWMPICTAQPTPKSYRIGIISGNGRLVEGSPTFEAFQQELRNRGYAEGTVLIDQKNAEGKYDRLPALLADLIALKVDVIVAAGTPEAAAAKLATSAIPIVFMAADPIGNKLVENLERPGGNLTGVAFIADRQQKQIETITLVVPGITRLAVLADKAYLPVPNEILKTEIAARTAGVQVQLVAAHDAKDFDEAFATMRRAHTQALMVLLSPVFSRTMSQIAEYAIKNKIPMMAPYQERSGALITYQADLPYISRRLAIFVGKILEGANPAGMPVETPLNSRLTVNLRTAAALGLVIPERVIQQADEVIK